jgi:hypothetical protein
MDKAIKLLNKQLKTKSQGEVAIELKISKATINLVLKQKYPNPQNIYQKIIDKFGAEPVEIVGVDTNKSALDLYKEIINGD